MMIRFFNLSGFSFGDFPRLKSWGINVSVTGAVKTAPVVFVFSVMFALQTGNLFSQEISIVSFRESGLDCDWDKSGSNRIMYTRKGKDTYYDIYFANPDGSNDTCLTCDHPLLPNRHIANPGWHPNGKWVVAVVEKKEHKRSSTHALPGFGAYCDIWLISTDGKKAFKLFETVNDYHHGIIAPRISPDGKKLLWTNRYKKPNFFSLKRAMGFWEINIANIVWSKDSVPSLANIKTISPEQKCFYESYGFSPDGSRVIFCSSMNRPSVWDQQIYTMDTTGKNVVRLTEKDYNEHGCFSPDGKKIVCMSNTNSTKKGTDWWIMNVDGTEKKRLTFFNEPGHPMYAGKANWTGLISFSPDGKSFVGGIQVSLITQEGKIVVVKM